MGNRSTLAGALTALAVAGCLLAAACGSDYSAPQITVTSTTRPPSLIEATGGARSSGGRVPNTTTVAPADPTDAIIPLEEPEQPAEPETTEVPTTLIDREELAEQLPDIGFVQACVAATGSYALMHAMVLNGATGAAEAAETAAVIKGLLPPSLHDELDTVTAAIASAATDGSFEPKPATKPGYVPANAALSSFFDSGCLG